MRPCNDVKCAVAAGTPFIYQEPLWQVMFLENESVDWRNSANYASWQRYAGL